MVENYNRVLDEGEDQHEGQDFSRENEPLGDVTEGEVEANPRGDGFLGAKVEVALGIGALQLGREDEGQGEDDVGEECRN